MAKNGAQRSKPENRVELVSSPQSTEFLEFSKIPLNVMKNY